jgi:aerobic-type carbon monoxide dehydrogenase small subunit (CoxS/CutS family)
MSQSLYKRIRTAERTLSRLLSSVKPTQRCSYNPHGLQCGYPAKRGFIYCTQHLKEILQGGYWKLNDFRVK